ncbi:hypothetical protein BGZ96_001315 [Linnemannia gamsii]|uniref:Uncharacterized protein n=1 Tax=Linnemannia gamsii TaxID=64522 RepID=A0ABQ7JMU2_9FUNG|nr:hypothetical protein BGZ96_001315 [Linnemannia gamsii]
MRLSITSIASIALVLASALSIASAQGNSTKVRFGICTCFEPQYDASCCMYAKGYMQNDGNVCDTPDAGESVKKFRSCCDRIKGRTKCKTGEREASHWPPEDSFGCGN